MKLSQIITENDDQLDYTGIPHNVVQQLSRYKSHYQQWAIDNINKHHDYNSVIDAIDYYINKIRDNRFQNLLQRYTPQPKNILTLSLDNIKSAQNDFETAYNRLTRKQRNSLRYNVLVDIPNLKIIKFEKQGVDDVDTAKALAAAAQFTKWCVIDVQTGNNYLNQGPVYLIIGADKSKLLCHIQSAQLMDEDDNEKKLPEKTCKIIDEYIPHFGIFCRSIRSSYYKQSVIHVPQLAYEYARDFIRGRWPEAEPTIMRSPKWACEYAYHVIGFRWPEAEQYIIKDTNRAVEYAIAVKKSRWPEAEADILKSVITAYRYFTQVIGHERWPQLERLLLNKYEQCGRFMKRDDGYFSHLAYHDIDLIQYMLNYAIHTATRWLEAESIIATVIPYACRYAIEVIKGPFIEAEHVILRDMQNNDVHGLIHRSDIGENIHDIYNYIISCKNGKWPEVLSIIMQYPQLAYEYARDVVKGRWLEAEPYIMQDPYYAMNYALGIIGDRWPEAEHIINDSPYSINYWNLIHNMKSRSRRNDLTNR